MYIVPLLVILLCIVELLLLESAALESATVSQMGENLTRYLIPIAFFGINEAYLILDKRNNSDNILKYPIKIAAAFPSLLLYSYDCCCVYYTYVLFSALKVCFWHYLIDYIFVQNIAEWESHSQLNMLLKVFFRGNQNNRTHDHRRCKLYNIALWWVLFWCNKLW